MERSLIRELHYINDIANVPSILERGILSHRLADRLASVHVTVADREVQTRRARKRIPTGTSSRALHEYANLYLHARNAMLYSLQGKGELTVLAVAPEILELEGVIVSDRNAAATTTRFWPALEGIAQLDATAVFAEWWSDSIDAKQRRMAEVLVPDRVAPQFIRHAYSPHDPAAERLNGRVGGRSLTIMVDPVLFFRSAL